MYVADKTSDTLLLKDIEHRLLYSKRLSGPERPGFKPRSQEEAVEVAHECISLAIHSLENKTREQTLRYLLEARWKLAGLNTNRGIV